MSIKEDFLNEVKIGTQVELVVGPKNITGRVVSLGLDVVKIRMNDGGEPSIALDAVSCYEILSDNTANLPILAVESKPDFKSYEEEFNKYFDEHKEIKSEINKINNVYEYAVRNDDLQYKTGKITALLSALRENYCDVREIGLYVAYMYKRIGNYCQAISTYKYLNEEKNAKVCAMEVGDENLYNSVDVFRKKENVKNAVKSSADFSVLPTEHLHYPANGRFEGTLVSYTKGIGRGYIDGDDGCRYSYLIKNVKDKDLEFYLENTKERNFNFKVEYKTFTNEYGKYPCAIVLADDSQREKIVNYRKGKADIESNKNDVDYPLEGRMLRYPKIKNPCKMGCKLALENNYVEAEPYLLDALQRNDNIEAAIGNLVTIWMKYDRLDEALKYLGYYANVLPYEKLWNLKRGIFDKGKRFEELLECIKILLPITWVTSKRIHLYGQKCRALMELKKYEEAIVSIEEYKELCQKNNKDVFVNNCNRMLATCYYETGKRDKAKELAKELLLIRANDDVALSIMNDRKIEENILDDWDEAIMDYSDAAEYSSKGLNKYILRKFEEINLDSWAQGTFKEFIQNGKVIGSVELILKEVNKYWSDILKQPIDSRADSCAGLAKVLWLLNKSSGIDNQEVVRKLYWCVAQAMAAYGDRIALGMANTGDLDTLRFMYVESLNLVKVKSESKKKTYGKMICTFYASLSELNDIVQHSGTTIKEEYLRRIKGEKCRSLREMFLVTFSLEDKYNDLTKLLLELLLKNSLNDREELLNFGGIAQQADRSVIPESDRYYQQWLKQKREYNYWLNNVKEELKKVSGGGFNSITPMKFKDDLADILQSQYLCVLDAGYFKRILEIAVQLNLALPDLEFDNKETKFKSIVEQCRSLKSDIQASPTGFSFEYLMDVADAVQNYTIMKLDEAYATHEPVLSVDYRAGYFDVEKREVPFYFTLRNEDNKQNAEITNIEFLRENEEISKVENSEKSILRVRNGNSEEGEWNIRVAKNYGLKYVEFEIAIRYSYFVSHENRVEKTIKIEVQIPLMDSGEFKKVVNPYSNIVNSNGVPENMFFGRKNEVDDIVQSLNKDGKLMAGRGIIIYGQKRAGKSSILDNLQKYIENKYGRDAYIFVKFSVLKINDHTITGILRAMYSGVEHSIRKNYPEIYERVKSDNVILPRAMEIEKFSCPADGYNEVMNELFEKLYEYGDGNKYIPMFLIDEFTYIYQWINEEKETDAGAFPNFWKAFLQSNRVCTIAVGMDNASSFLTSYANDFACMKLWRVSYLSEEGARELICKPTHKEDGTSYFNEDVVKIILRLTAGSACLIVILCDGLIGYMNKNKITIATKLVFIRFLKQIIEKENWDVNFEFLFVDPSVFGEKAAKKRRSLDNKRILTTIACNCNDKHELAENLIDVNGLSEECEEYRTLLLNELVHRDVLVRSVVDNRNVYRIKVDLVRNVLRVQNGKGLEDL